MDLKRSRINKLFIFYQEICLKIRLFLFFRRFQINSIYLFRAQSITDQCLAPSQRLHKDCRRLDQTDLQRKRECRGQWRRTLCNLKTYSS